MEVSRRLQVIEMVGMRWGKETHLMGAENLSLVVVGSGAPTKPDFLTRASRSFFKLLLAVHIVLEASWRLLEGV